MAEKLEMMSSNIIQENIDYIASKFPNALKEVMENGKLVKKIDFDILKQELSAILIDDRQERYQMTWPDKKKSILLANSRINATLRPIKEKSVDFDNTKNLYIEGDNLNVLKLLRETYLGKVKMIYIDPPYNTGNDFVYKDDFSQSTEEYFSNSGQYDELGNRLVQNSESNGRFHTDWLNMMYPRLKIAKDFLKEDGIIFISIDENEITNLSKICDEIFESQNLIAQLVWRKSKGSGNDSKYLMIEHEYILAYAKNIKTFKFENIIEEISDEKYVFEDEYVSSRGRYYLSKLDRGSKGYVKSLDYGIEAPDGTLVYPNGRNHEENDGWRWMWSKKKVEWGIENKFIVVQKNNLGKWAVYSKSYAFVDNDNKPLIRKKLHKSHLGFDENILNISANSEIKSLFGKAYFSYPKPTALISKLLSMINLENEIVLDFFSGSGTTAHSIMKNIANSVNNNKNIKYILIQLDELFDTNSEQYQKGFITICDLAQERIRRAAAKIKGEIGLLSKDLDLGFRVLKLDTTNMTDVYYNPNQLNQSLLDQFVGNVKEDRTALDLLFQVMLELGIELSAKIEEKELNGKTYFVVNENDIVACFDNGIDDDLTKELAKIKPIYAVFKDSSFTTDSANINCEQIFKSISPSTTIKVI